MRFVRCRIALLSILCILISPFAIAEEVLIAKVYRDYPGYIDSPTCTNPRLSPATVKQLAVKEQTSEMLTVEDSVPSQRARKAYRDYPGYLGPATPVESLVETAPEELIAKELSPAEVEEESLRAERLVADELARQKLDAEKQAQAKVEEARIAVEKAAAERVQAQRLAELKAVMEGLAIKETEKLLSSLPEKQVVPEDLETDEVAEPLVAESPRQETAAITAPVVGEVTDSNPVVATELKELTVDHGQAVVETNGMVETFRYFSLTNPPRLVIDLYDLEHSFATDTIDIDESFSQVRIGRHPDKTRLVFDASGMVLPETQVVKQPAGIIVTWDSGSQADRLEAEKPAAQEVAEAKLASQQAEADRLAGLALAAQRAEQERAEAERLARQKAEAERLEAEKIAALEAEQKALAERLAAERLAARKAEDERLAVERVEAERLATIRAERERVAAERLAAAELAAKQAEAERLAAMQAAAEKLEAENLAAERVAEVRAAEKKQALQDAATDKYLVADDSTATMMAAKMVASSDSTPRDEEAPLVAGPVYGGIWGGVLFPDSLDSNNRSLTADVDYDTGYGVGLLMGYDFGDWRLDVEGSYRSSGVDKLSVNSAASPTPGGDLEVSALMINGYYDFEMPGDLSPYLGAGVGVAEVSLDGYSSNGAVVADDSDTVFAGQLSAGVLYALNEKVALDLGYRYMMTGDAELNAPSGKLEADADNHLILVGVKFHF